MHRSKLFLYSLVLLLPLTGCFGSNPSDGSNDVLVVKKLPVQISVPKAWREISAADLKNLGSDVILAYSSLNYSNGFANNISVTQEKLSQDYSSLQYGEANILNSSKYLDDYTKLSERDVTIKNMDNQDVPVKLHTFEARFDKLDRKRRYVQLYATQGQIGYTVTVTIALEESDTGKFENLATSLRFVRE